MPTVTTVTISRTPARAAAARPLIDVLIEKLALRLLAWADARAERPIPAPEQLARVAADEHARQAREERSVRVWSSFPYGK